MKRFILLFLLLFLLFASTVYATDPTVDVKDTGDTLSSDEFNNVVDSVKTKQDKPAEGAFADGDKTKLDGIETGADVTDATNVAAAGAVMQSDVDDTAVNGATTVPISSNWAHDLLNRTVSGITINYPQVADNVFLQAFNSTLSDSGGYTRFRFGVNDSTGNSGALGFTYYGGDNASNYVSLGLDGYSGHSVYFNNAGELCFDDTFATKVFKSGTDLVLEDASNPGGVTLSTLVSGLGTEITSLSCSNYKFFYSLGGGAPLEGVLGEDGKYYRFNGVTSAPTASYILAGDLPTEIDPDKIGTDGTANDKIEAENINIQSADIDGVDSIFWTAAGLDVDGTQCDYSKVTINSGPVQTAIVCTDNDASTIYGAVVMPDGYGGSGADTYTVTFELEYVQTAADTGAMNSDITAMCRRSGDTVNSTWGTEVAIDDAAVSGSNIIDHTTSAAVTPNGTCAGGATLFWRWQLDATGTTTAVATLDILGIKMEFTKVLGDE